MLDKTISFRVNGEICREFYNKYGDIMAYYLRSCLQYAVEQNYEEISKILFHLY